MTFGDKIRDAMARIDDAGKDRMYRGGEVKTMLNTLASAADKLGRGIAEENTCRSPTHVKPVRRGDVFISKTFGGKVRPWVVLRVRTAHVEATALSSANSAPELVPSKCRFWPDCWLGAGVVTFSEDQATREVTRPYTNLRHLDEVETAIIERMRPKPPKSVSDVLMRVRSRNQLGHAEDCA